MGAVSKTNPTQITDGPRSSSSVLSTWLQPTSTHPGYTSVHATNHKVYSRACNPVPTFIANRASNSLHMSWLGPSMSPMFFIPIHTSSYSDVRLWKKTHNLIMPIASLKEIAFHLTQNWIQNKLYTVVWNMTPLKWLLAGHRAWLAEGIANPRQHGN